MTHTDVPDNDFTELFHTLSEDPDTYLRKDPASYASAVGRSFYSQILPSYSVNLAWSIQWLGRTPMPNPDHVLAAYSRDADVRAAYAKQAAHDWHEFIAYRGRELSPGGRLVVTTMAVTEDGDFGWEPLAKALVAALAELTARGVLSEDEIGRMAIPCTGRRERDIRSPFAPSGVFEKLTIAHLDVFDAEDRSWAQYRVDGKADELGARWAAFLRTAMLPILVAALPTDRRENVIGELCAGVAAHIAADPAEVRVPLAQIVIEKVQPKH